MEKSEEVSRLRDALIYIHNRLYDSLSVDQFARVEIIKEIHAVIDGALGDLE